MNTENRWLKTFHEVAKRFFINRIFLFLILLTAVQYLPVYRWENEYLVISPKAMRYASYIIHILVYNVSECHLHCQFLNVSA
ncbi:hypothetical protein T07_11028 [Trichinella nelsoni]|uniref:Uncharacterized protein n=1 Tax=Trichinella nelsoni TaxID=6336 RepID=A0A0V0SEM6_9BILA|nr:hypothetical protein T07_11028 [Trichinella nelsoni]